MVCAVCPVRVDCLDFGLRERYGIWGGKAERARQKIRSAEDRLPAKPDFARVTVSRFGEGPGRGEYKRELRERRRGDSANAQEWREAHQ